MSDDVIASASGAPGGDEGARRALGFRVQVDGAPPLSCREVRGFDQAAAAAMDPDEAPPPRLVLIGPDDAALAWLSAWAEDSERVRRTVRICRLVDDFEVTAVATLASYGYGVATALSVESITAVPEGDMLWLLRSGVHSKDAIEAMLRELAAGTPDGDDASWFIHG